MRLFFLHLSILVRMANDLDVADGGDDGGFGTSRDFNDGFAKESNFSGFNDENGGVKLGSGDGFNAGNELDIGNDAFNAGGDSFGGGAFGDDGFNAGGGGGACRKYATRSEVD